MNRTVVYATALGMVLVLGAWSLTSGGGGKLSAQLQLAASGRNAPQAWGVMRDGPVKGMAPGAYGAPCPAHRVPDAIVGPHPVKYHPKRCSPNMSAQMTQAWDWMYCPPSEDDL